MNRKQRCCSCCSTTFEGWIAKAQNKIGERFESSVTKLTEEEGSSEALLGGGLSGKQLTTQHLQANLSKTVSGMHLVLRDPTNNIIDGAFIGFKAHIKDLEVGKFVSYLQAFAAKPPAPFIGTETTWSLAEAMDEAPSRISQFAGVSFKALKRCKVCAYPKTMCSLVLAFILLVIIIVVASNSGSEY